MFGTLHDSPAQRAAASQVQAWVRERFSLSADDAVLVTELACQLPGCPPLETVIAFWCGPGAVRHHCKVFKPVLQVQPDDLPPYWLKNALVSLDGACDCC